jgi:hypothetical protein
MRMKIDLKMEIELPDGARTLRFSDLWDNSQASPASKSGTTNTSANPSNSNPLGSMLCNLLERASEASQKAQDRSRDATQRSDPG